MRIEELSTLQNSQLLPGLIEMLLQTLDGHRLYFDGVPLRVGGVVLWLVPLALLPSPPALLIVIYPTRCHRRPSNPFPVPLRSLRA